MGGEITSTGSGRATFGPFVAVGPTDMAGGLAAIDYGVSFLVPCIYQRFMRDLSAQT